MVDRLIQFRFAVIPAAMAVALASLAGGGLWLWSGAVFFLVFAVLADTGQGAYRAPTAAPCLPFLEGVVQSGPPLTALLAVALILVSAAPGTSGEAVALRLGLPTLGAEGWFAIGGFAVTSGILAGAGAVTFAHELIHRRSRRDWLAGQFVLARCLHPGVALEHLHGHHPHVGTPRDRSTAPRGMGFWRFLVVSAFFEWRNAALHEAARLRRAGQPVFSRANRYVEAVAIACVMPAAAFLLGGGTALLAFLVSAFFGVLVIELSNYVLHYGLVREAGKPVRPRHSWNAPLFFSTGAMLNGQHHSHHHASAATPFWALTMIEGAPAYPWCTGMMSVIALVPPLWFRVVRPHLDHWDRALASPGEIALLRGGTTPPGA